MRQLQVGWNFVPLGEIDQSQPRVRKRELRVQVNRTLKVLAKP